MNNLRLQVLICKGTGCVSARSDLIKENFDKAIEHYKIKDVEAMITGCFGFCGEGPIVKVEPDNVFYTHVRPEDVNEIVAFALEILGESKREINEKVDYALDLVNLSDKKKAYPSELSGGESQRVSIARAIVNKAPYLVCDEPTGNLDESTAWDIMSALKNINDDGKTVIMATHAVNIVDKFNKRVVTLDQGQIVSDVKEGGYYESNKTVL